MNKSFGSRLKDLRGSTSQAAMAGALGIAQTTYSGWEREARQPNLSELCVICRHFNVSADWLLGVTDAPSAPVLAAKVKQARESDTYWRDLAVSQQETIAKLTALLTEGRASAVAPVRTGGRGVIKTA